MKVYVLISATARPGKSGEAQKAVAESVKYLNEKQDYVGKYDAVRPLQGPNSLVYWLCQYDSLSDYEKDVLRRTEDPKWSEVWAVVDQAVDADNITAQILKGIEA